MNTISHVTN